MSVKYEGRGSCVHALLLYPILRFFPADKPPPQKQRILSFKIVLPSPPKRQRSYLFPLGCILRSEVETGFGFEQSQTAASLGRTLIEVSPPE